MKVFGSFCISAHLHNYLSNFLLIMDVSNQLYAIAVSVSTGCFLTLPCFPCTPKSMDGDLGVLSYVREGGGGGGGGETPFQGALTSWAFGQRPVGLSEF